MALSYDINTVLNIDSQGVTINALGAEVGVAGDAYEMAFFGVANFLNGNYTQDSADVNDINSTVTVNEAALNNAHFFYVADVSGSGTDVYPGGGESDYGANITQTGTIYGSGAVTSVLDASTPTPATRALSDLALFGNDFIAMTNIRNGSGDSVVDSGVLQPGQSSVGDGLLQAISAALFRKLGKNAALLNDVSLVSSLNSQFHTVLNAEMGEAPGSTGTYENSEMFQRYLESGRYRADTEAGADINAVIDYNLNNTVVNMVVKITGAVSDSDAAAGGINFASNTDAINNVFGTSGTNHLVAVDTSGGGTVGTYSIKVFVQLLHDERF